jgi:uncharacterized membrane protein
MSNEMLFLVLGMAAGAMLGFALGSGLVVFR